MKKSLRFASADWVIRHTTMHWLVPESSNAKKSDKE